MSTTPRVSLRQSIDNTTTETGADQGPWQVLPSLGQMRRAVARKVVSRGLAYDLPPDKQSISLACNYRTNLTKIFASDSRQQGSRGGLRTSFDSSQLNAHSEQILNQYQRSAPSAGTVGRSWERRMTVARLRSATSGPLHHETSWPEADKLREMANQIVKADGGETAAGPQGEGPTMTPGRESAASGRQAGAVGAGVGNVASGDDVITTMQKRECTDSPAAGEKLTGVTRPQQQPNKARMFDSYEALKQFRVPPTRPLPDSSCTAFLSHQKAEDIWKWILNNEQQTEFSYFLELCN